MRKAIGVALASNSKAVLQPNAEFQSFSIEVYQRDGTEDKWQIPRLRNFLTKGTIVNEFLLLSRQIRSGHSVDCCLSTKKATADKFDDGFQDLDRFLTNFTNRQLTAVVEKFRRSELCRFRRWSAGQEFRLDSQPQGSIDIEFQDESRRLHVAYSSHRR